MGAVAAAAVLVLISKLSLPLPLGTMRRMINPGGGSLFPVAWSYEKRDIPLRHMFCEKVCAVFPVLAKPLLEG